MVTVIAGFNGITGTTSTTGNWGGGGGGNSIAAHRYPPWPFDHGGSESKK